MGHTHWLFLSAQCAQVPVKAKCMCTADLLHVLLVSAAWHLQRGSPMSRSAPEWQFPLGCLQTWHPICLHSFPFITKGLNKKSRMSFYFNVLRVACKERGWEGGWDCWSLYTFWHVGYMQYSGDADNQSVVKSLVCWYYAGFQAENQARVVVKIGETPNFHMTGNSHCSCWQCGCSTLFSNDTKMKSKP